LICVHFSCLLLGNHYCCAERERALPFDHHRNSACSLFQGHTEGRGFGRSERRGLKTRDVVVFVELVKQVIRNTLYRSYLEDFYAFCQKLGGVTAEVMGDLLRFEADRRSITITINSLGTELNAADRQKLYPSFGLLYPEGVTALEKVFAFFFVLVKRF
jgi:hypothetical protein